MATAPATDERGGDAHLDLPTPAAKTLRTFSADLPVLFQLADVNRPKAKRTLPSIQEQPTAAVSHKPQESLAISASQQAALSEPLKLEPLSAYTPAALDPSTLWSPSISTLLEPPPSSARVATAEPSAKLSGGEAIAPGGSSDATIASPSTGSKSKKPAVEELTAPKSADALSERRRQAAKQPSWFATHGKLISIGFVLALVITVIVARNKKPEAPDMSQAAWDMKHPGDAANHLADGGPQIDMPPATADLPPSDAKLSQKTDEKSPVSSESLADKRPAGGSVSQVDLLPPTIVQQAAAESSKPTAETAPIELVESPSKTVAPPATTAGSNMSTQPAQDPLFTWPRSDTHVAARPEASATSPPSTSAATPPSSYATQAKNPGEVLNPYATGLPPSASRSAASDPPNGPVATTALAPHRETAPGSGAPPATAGDVNKRSPYILPGSPQDVGGYSAPNVPAYGPQPAPTGPGYAPTAAPPPVSGLGQSPYAPHPGATAPAAPGYQPVPPATPSPYLPAGSAPQPSPGYGANPAPYGAPPMGPQNTPPTTDGYRYERTGSGLY
jgi:hypothetical protein